MDYAYALSNITEIHTLSMCMLPHSQNINLKGNENETKREFIFDNRTRTNRTISVQFCISLYAFGFCLSHICMIDSMHCDNIHN